MRNYAPTKASREDFLPRNAFLSAKFFALRYPDWKEELAALRYSGTKAIRYTGMPHGTDVGNPVEAIGIKIDALRRKMGMVEQAAIDTSPDLCQWILKGATEDYTADELQGLGMPASNSTYYRLRRRFYSILSNEIDRHF